MAGFSNLIKKMCGRPGSMTEIGRRKTKATRLGLEGLETRLVPASLPMDFLNSQTPALVAQNAEIAPDENEAMQDDKPVVTSPFSLPAGTTVTSLGDGQISIRRQNGQLQNFTPFPGYYGALNVTTINRNGGAQPDGIMIAVAGPSSPHVLVVDAATGKVSSSFYAFDPGFKGGVSVTGGLAKVDGVTRSLLICGASAGSEPSVSLFDAGTGNSLGAFYSFDKAYKGGVRVTLSEPEADGKSLVVVASTINSHVVVFDPDNYLQPVSSFYAFEPDLAPKGMQVAAGDLDNDGNVEIIATSNAGPKSPEIFVFNAYGMQKSNKHFQAFNGGNKTGVRVAVADYDRDGKLDILAGSTGYLNVFRYEDLSMLDSVFISLHENGFDVASNHCRGNNSFDNGTSTDPLPEDEDGDLTPPTDEEPKEGGDTGTDPLPRENEEGDLTPPANEEPIEEGDNEEEGDQGEPPAEETDPMQPIDNESPDQGDTDGNDDFLPDPDEEPEDDEETPGNPQPEPVGVPPPENLDSSSVQRSSFRLSWRSPAKNEDRFEVWVKVDGNWKRSENVPGDRTNALIEYEASGGPRLKAGKTYQVKIRVFDSAGKVSGWSPEISVKMSR